MFARNVIDSRIQLCTDLNSISSTLAVVPLQTQKEVSKIEKGNNNSHADDGGDDDGDVDEDDEETKEKTEKRESIDVDGSHTVFDKH